MAIVGQQRIVIEGAGAVVRRGYQRAARLGAWRLEGDRVTAAVEAVDGFLITQAPLVFEVTYADGSSVRRALSEVTVAGGALSGRLSKVQG